MLKVNFAEGHFRVRASTSIRQSHIALITQLAAALNRGGMRQSVTHPSVSHSPVATASARAAASASAAGSARGGLRSEGLPCAIGTMRKMPDGSRVAGLVRRRINGWR